MVFLKYDEPCECLWAVQSQSNTAPIDTLPPKEEATPAEKTGRIVPLPRPKPIDVQQQLPANAVVAAEFIKYVPQGDRAWITVAIPVSDTQKRNWSFPIYKEVNMGKFKDIAAGKRCRVRIKKWITKKGELTPLLDFIGWIS